MHYATRKSIVKFPYAKEKSTKEGKMTFSLQ